LQEIIVQKIGQSSIKIEKYFRGGRGESFAFVGLNWVCFFGGVGGGV